jgi:small subunit ribosomal protein S8
MVIDQIANLIVSLKNGGEAGHTSVVSSFSIMKASILELLQKEGYVGTVSKKGKKVSKFIEVVLLYEDGKPRITGVERLSTFSKRTYKGAKEIHPVKNGHGLMVISTPKGILTDKEARKEKVGGEVLFKIW